MTRAGRSPHLPALSSLNCTTSETAFMSSIPFDEPLRYPYKAGKTWAGEYFTVIPGTRDKKAPMATWKHLVWPERSLPTKDESIRWRALGMTEEANPLLLLDSPFSEALCLCVVDVDHPSALKPVLAWLLSIGITSTLAVSTGREGGGVQLYFRREALCPTKYRSLNAVPLFGTFTDADGKERGCVDFKAYNSYVVAPGAVHKSGKVYAATWAGSDVAALGGVLQRLPVMPLEAWLAAEGRTGADATTGNTNTTWVVAGKEWEQVVADGRERQPCPWCGRGDSRVLAYSEEKGTAHCFHERTTRKLCKVLPSVASPGTTLVDEVLRDAPSAPMEEAEVLYARHWAGFLLEEKLVPVRIDPDDIPILEEDHALFGKERELAMADRLLASRYGADVGRWISCARAPFLCVGSGSAKGGRYTEMRATCRSWSCPDCGPHLREAMRAAVLGTSIELTFGTMDAALGTAVADVLASPGTNVPGLSQGLRGDRLIPSDRSLSPRTSCALLVRTSVGHDNLAEVFRRHVERTAGAFQWVGLRLNPEEVAYLFFFAADGSGDPEPDSSFWYLLDSETPTPGRFDRLIEEAFERIDIEAWTFAIAKGAAKRISILAGPSALTSHIMDVFDWLTGRSRVLVGKKAADPQRCGIATFKPEEVREVLAEAFQQVIRPEAKPSVAKSGNTVASVDLPASPGPTMREALSDGTLKTVAGHRRGKRATSEEIDLLATEVDRLVGS
jgi:Bifunctional DNA primase/polymerase, N-terminal